MPRIIIYWTNLVNIEIAAESATFILKRLGQPDFVWLRKIPVLRLNFWTNIGIGNRHFLRSESLLFNRLCGLQIHQLDAKAVTFEYL